MAEAFLHELLQAHNTVHIKGERCGICLEGYGTLSRETGTIEVGIRLPCNHSVGSACIAIWLKNNNTCPICRREFFQAQPRPYLEHGIMDGQGDEEEADQDITEINEVYCANLGLDMDACRISEMLIQKLTEPARLREGHSPSCIVAVSIYMASHLARQATSPRSISDVSDVAGHHIRESYDALYPERENLTNPQMLSLLEEVYGQTRRLNWPLPGNELSDEQIDNFPAWRKLEERCVEGCRELGLDARVTDLSTHIAAELFSAGLRARLSSREMTAASIYMALHLVGNSFRTAGRVAEAVYMSESRLRAAYDVAFEHRHLLYGRPWFDDYRGGTMGSALGRLPIPRASD